MGKARNVDERVLGRFAPPFTRPLVLFAELAPHCIDCVPNMTNQPTSCVPKVEAQSHTFNDAMFNMPEAIRFSAAFQTIETAVKELLVTCPLMSSLQSEFMRERHWDQLGVKLVRRVRVCPLAFLPVSVTTNGRACLWLAAAFDACRY